MKNLSLFLIALTALLMSSCTEEVRTHTISGTVYDEKGKELSSIPFEVYQYDYSLGYDLLTVGIGVTSDFDLDTYDGDLTAIGKSGMTDSQGKFDFTMTEEQMEEDYIVIFNISEGSNEDYCIEDYKFDASDFTEYDLNFDITLPDYSECE